MNVVAYLSLVAITTFSSCIVAGTIVQTTNGKVQGKTEIIPDSYGQDVEVDVFYGIPYAKPPAGDLRFRRPVPSLPWSGVLQATMLPNSCWQVPLGDPVIIPNPPLNFTEDCLYLNIWRPRCQCSGKDRKSSKLTTMVWSHGGFLTFGSSTVSLYDGAKLAATNCVIVATINFRIGPLGFLFLDLEENPGNMGLVDAAVALNWIYNNVENFGGSRNSITVFGLSSGGRMTSLLAVSPLTRNLISNVIIESGSPASTALPLAQKSRETMLQLGLNYSAFVGCPSQNSLEALRCLKQKDAAFLSGQYLLFNRGLVNFLTGVVDHYFFQGPLQETLDRGAFRRTNILLGYTRDEGTFYLNTLFPADDGVKSLPRPVPQTDEQIAQKLTQLLSISLKQGAIPQIIEELRDVYDLDRLKLVEGDNASLYYLNNITTDFIIRCPTLLLASIYARDSQDVYLYSFKHFPDNSTRLKPWAGALHTVETPFVFGNNVPDIPNFSNREDRLSQSIMTYWTNFAKFGNPNQCSQYNPRWPTYSPPDPGNILLFTETADIQVGLTKSGGCDYWNNLPREYLKQ